MRISDWSSDVCSSDLFVDDAGEVVGLLQVAVARARLLAQRGNQRVAAGVVDQHVVGRDAGLAAVEPLAGGQARCGLFDGEVGGNDRRDRKSTRLNSSQ